MNNIEKIIDRLENLKKQIFMDTKAQGSFEKTTPSVIVDPQEEKIILPIVDTQGSLKKPMTEGIVDSQEEKIILPQDLI